MLRACTTRSGIWQRSWTTSGSSDTAPQGTGRAVPLWIPARSHLDRFGLLPLPPGFRAASTGYAHTHPDSEEWITVLGGIGEARFGTEVPLSLRPGMVIGRAERHPHGFVSGPEPMYLLSMQLPRPAEGATSWDEPGTTTDPVPCGKTGAPCRRCSRCGGHSAPGPMGAFRCENCSFTF